MDKHDEANANAPNKPQAVVTPVIHSVSSVAVLSTAVATEFAGGCGRSARAERVCCSVVGLQPVDLLLYKPLPCLHSSWVLRGADWYLFTDVSKQPSDPSFDDQAVKVGSYLPLWRMKPLSHAETSVNDYQSPLRNIPEERKPHLHHGESLKSRKTVSFLFWNFYC